ncbi:MAG: UvrD-helicase domain-containing protein, partial [Bacteroidaceae bacterium]|nr:UvrD-helicase domain-containing protein [Bacteroidaceae bacterium]
MKNITYYSAGAGSGKTYTLTHLLAEKIQSGIAPSEVILTTFTKAAAADFRERARAVLYKEGMNEQAALLDQALIGTVHSVGESFIHRYWYLLGLSPDMKVMDEDSTKIYIDQSLSQLPTPEDIRQFRQFQQMFKITKRDDERTVDNPMFWKDWLKIIIEMGSSYRVADFTHSHEYSIERIRNYFKPSGKDFDLKSHDRYLPMLHAVVDIDEVDQRTEAQKRVKKAQNFIKQKVWSILDYSELGKFLSKLPKTIHIKQHPEILNAAAELLGIWHSNQVIDAMERLVTRLFELATQWCKDYAEYKKEMRIIDYNDMEVYMLELLQKPAIAEEISGRYKCLMVDEFQDSSPIQVDIFNRLSDLVSESYWCGDSKPA